MHRDLKIGRVIGIYCISNKTNDRKYIGSSINCRDRIFYHLKQLRLLKHANSKLQNHVNKYGIDDLEFSLMEECTKEVLIEREQYWIDFYNSSKEGFNIQSIAGFPYKNLTDEEIDKRRDLFGHKFGTNIYLYNYKGEFIKKYTSISSLSREIKKGVSTIHSYLFKGKVNKNYIFSNTNLSQEELKELINTNLNHLESVKKLRIINSRKSLKIFNKDMEKIKNSVVSYELAEILDGRIDSIFHYSKMDKLLLPVKDINNPLDYYKAPILSDVIDWIFQELYINKMDKINQDVEWLEFWYTILLEHKFSLMYEFIGRLEEWFEYNEYYILPFRIKDGWQVNIDYFQNDSEEMLTDDSINNYFDTKQQATHEAIMKVFQLLKEDNYERK